MFLGNVIKERRKTKGLTQGELVEGLCRQYIISKIEKHNQAPSITLLIQICLRLDLTLNDVFSDFSTTMNKETGVVLTKLLDQVFMNELVDDGPTELALVKSENLDDEQQMSYHFLMGWFAMTDSALSAQFEMDKLLRLTKMDTYNIYTELAYMIKGLAAEQQQDDEHALEYYKMIQDALKANSLIPNATFEQLSLIFKTLAQFYFRHADWRQAKQVAQRGLDLVVENKSMLNLDHFYHILAVAKGKLQENNEREEEQAKIITEILDEK